MQAPDEVLPPIVYLTNSFKQDNYTKQSLDHLRFKQRIGISERVVANNEDNRGLAFVGMEFPVSRDCKRKGY